MLKLLCLLFIMKICQTETDPYFFPLQKVAPWRGLGNAEKCSAFVSWKSPPQNCDFTARVKWRPHLCPSVQYCCDVRRVSGLPLLVSLRYREALASLTAVRLIAVDFPHMRSQVVSRYTWKIKILSTTTTLFTQLLYSYEIVTFLSGYSYENILR